MIHWDSSEAEQRNARNRVEGAARQVRTMRRWRLIVRGLLALEICLCALAGARLVLDDTLTTGTTIATIVVGCLNACAAVFICAWWMPDVRTQLAAAVDVFLDRESKLADGNE